MLLFSSRIIYKKLKMVARARFAQKFSLFRFVKQIEIMR